MPRKPSLPKDFVKAAADRAEGIAEPEEPDTLDPALMPPAPSDPIGEEMKRKRAGAPTSYRPEYAKQAVHLSKLGATDYDLARAFDVAISSITLWKTKHPEFSAALKLGKDEADGQVERSLYTRATGYSFESEKVFQYGGQILRAPTIEHVPPDVTAQIFWLKNRRPDLWRDVHRHDISVTSVKDMSATQIDGLIAELGPIEEASASSRTGH